MTFAELASLVADWIQTDSHITDYRSRRPDTLAKIKAGLSRLEPDLLTRLPSLGDGLADFDHNANALLLLLQDRANPIAGSKQLDRIESALSALVAQKTIKDWYTTGDVAEQVGKAEYTVREWCRQGRIKATKKPCGRGKGGEWLVSHEELTRLRNEGLRPLGGRDLA